ncbi:MAG: DUF1615 family protein [Myxococcales bacterium]|nr:DUF1615 family protein [Myxococcales bacterium]
MSEKVSCGLLMFQRDPEGPRVLLVHPGGPFFRNKDLGAWSLPKGVPEPGEERLACAVREFQEEVGFVPTPPLWPLGEVKQKGGKIVHAWAFEARLPEGHVLCANTFELEWPPRSGQRRCFPEIDRAELFTPSAAREKINPAQAVFIDRFLKSGVLVCALLLGFFGCGTPRAPVRPGPKPPVAVDLSPTQIETLLPSKAKPRSQWAEAVWYGLLANDLLPRQPEACAVIAIVGQESGFQADPAVPGLAKLVKQRLEAHQEQLPLVGKPLFERLLSARSADDARSFRHRLDAVRTEGDLDRVFRDMLHHYRAHYPTTYATVNVASRLFDVESLEALNPITTAGSMQVNVRFAEAWAAHEKGTDPAHVRDELYTIKGGIYYGTARLMGHTAAYEDPIYRFADYNAGVYASRNAAFQAQVGTLIGTKLSWDGDVLSYDERGAPLDAPTKTLAALEAFAARYAPALSVRELRKDARGEKSASFEQTKTYKAVKRAFAQLTGRPPKYAILPDVAISSPKFSQTRSTAWFAQSVDRRYRDCLAKVPAPGR